MLGRVLMTSFNVGAKFTDGTLLLSIASYAPQGKNYPMVPEFAPLTEKGHRFRIRDHGTPQLFLEAMYRRCVEEGDEAIERITRLMERPARPVALMCWCPGTKVASTQLREHGTFVCHREAVAKYLASRGVDVYYDRDAARMYRMSR
jgi:hypothetical protein